MDKRYLIALRGELEHFVPFHKSYPKGEEYVNEGVIRLQQCLYSISIGPIVKIIIHSQIILSSSHYYFPFKGFLVSFNKNVSDTFLVDRDTRF